MSILSKNTRNWVRLLFAALIMAAPYIYAAQIAFGGQVIIFQGSGGGGEANAEYGYTTIGGTEASSPSERAICFDVADDITVSRAYMYGHDNSGSQTIEMAIYDYNPGSPGDPTSQIGSCSNTVSMSDTAAWNEVIFDPPIFLAGSAVYCLSEHNPTAGTMTYFYDETDDRNYFGQNSCGVSQAAYSARRATMTISNYDAH